MKKQWGAFFMAETILVLGVLAAVRALWGIHWALSAFAGASGIIAAAAYWLHFRSLEYSLEDSVIIIRKGFLIKSRRGIPLENVLITQSLAVCGYTLLTAVKTAGGGAVMFCALDSGRPAS